MTRVGRRIRVLASDVPKDVPVAPSGRALLPSVILPKRRAQQRGFVLHSIVPHETPLTKIQRGDVLSRAAGTSAQVRRRRSLVIKTPAPHETPVPPTDRPLTSRIIALRQRRRPAGLVLRSLAPHLTPTDRVPSSRVLTVREFRPPLGVVAHTNPPHVAPVQPSRAWTGHVLRPVTTPRHRGRLIWSSPRHDAPLIGPGGHVPHTGPWEPKEADSGAWVAGEPDTGGMTATGPVTGTASDRSPLTGTASDRAPKTGGWEDA